MGEEGGNETVVYFGREVEEALLDYIEERKHIIAVTGHENALFLSLQKKRMSVRSVEKLVKKYSSLITNLKKITPHKLSLSGKSPIYDPHYAFHTVILFNCNQIYCSIVPYL